MLLKLFYSHAWADKAGARVKQLLVILQKDYEVWLDKKQIDLGDHIDETVAAGFVRQDLRDSLIVANNVTELFDGFANYRPAQSEKWIPKNILK